MLSSTNFTWPILEYLAPHILGEIHISVINYLTPTECSWKDTFSIRWSSTRKIKIIKIEITNKLNKNLPCVFSLLEEVVEATLVLLLVTFIPPSPTTIPPPCVVVVTPPPILFIVLVPVGVFGAKI